MTRSSLRAALGALVLLSVLIAPAAAQSPSSPGSDVRASDLGAARLERHSATGAVRFAGGTSARPVASSAELRSPSTHRAAARRFMERYGSLFGIRDRAAELRVERVSDAGAGRRFVRYQQVHHGIPVLGGQLMIQVDGRGNVISANGEASPDLLLDVKPTVTAAAASRTALSAIAKARGVARTDLSASGPSLAIYDPELLGGPSLPFTRLVWRLDVTNRAGDMREFVLIDAVRGGVALHFDQIAGAKKRITCDANNTATKYPCTAAQAARTESSGPSGVVDVNNAHVFSGHTYDFFFKRFGRDSLDGEGMTLKSTVRYCDPSFACPYQNAFWDGKQMVYGTGFANADDVVAHELTHGVTDHTSSLFYYYQSGAINEALSDIFGEFVDLTNGVDGAGGTGAAVRWLLGEDLPGIGAIRDMEHPPDFNQPDRMQSPIYWGTAGDNGGVHYNSGVANKAAFLMTDGGTFNGQTLTAIGIDRAAAVWYRVEVNYLGTASDYADLGSALNQACTDLIGSSVKNSAGTVTGTIAASHCTQVGKAVTATQMALQATNAPAPEAPICTSGSPSNVFFDNLENTASGNWTKEVIGGSNAWYYPQNAHPYIGFDATYATSGVRNFWGDGFVPSNDSTIRMTATRTIPASAFLHFRHAYDLEASYDGGVVEYRIGAGAWTDANGLPSINGYNGTVGALGGRAGFTSASNGYISTRYDLSSLAGQNVRFRFRMGTDSSISDWGWFIDDFRIYTCATAAVRQPDGRIRIGTSGAFIGNNIFNTTGAGQSRTASAPGGSTVTFDISVQNDGSAAEKLKVKGGGSTPDYTVTYKVGTTDVTAAVVAGTHRTPVLAVNGTQLIRVTVRVKGTAPAGSKVTRKVTITSVGDSTKKDAVKFVAKRA